MTGRDSKRAGTWQLSIKAPSFANPTHPDAKPPEKCRSPSNQGGGDGAPRPPGSAFAHWLSHLAETQGMQIPARWQTYTGHAFETVWEGTRFDCTLELRDAEEGLWMLGVETRRGFFPWSRARVAPDTFSALRATLRKLLDDHPRIWTDDWFNAS